MMGINTKTGEAIEICRQEWDSERDSESREQLNKINYHVVNSFACQSMEGQSMRQVAPLENNMTVASLCLFIVSSRNDQ